MFLTKVGRVCVPALPPPIWEAGVQALLPGPPMSSSGKKKELDKMVPKEPHSPALLDLNVYIRRVKCLPEHCA